MIDHIKGTVSAQYPNTIGVAMSEAISLSIMVPQETKFAIGQSINLYIHFHWHQDNGPTLYGFTSPVERQVFQLIISCSGIGPKIGLAILHHMPAQGFVATIIEENVQHLSSVQGIGKKKAETIILHLKDKAAKLLEKGIIPTEEMPNTQNLQDITQTLASLNYTKQEISSAMDHVKHQENFAALSFDILLRKALLFLSKRL